ncbi:hypothetical protein BP5796_05560 [Coleophoma crateriformis]|uniref:histidine kinase n=1 Tax=Coleophoma crateriformis TaxID=565419 RepID=A0A3D8S3J2_9HELO|nr:hypothetical protein BP5796_05560 [Coleophoma crateriformis]
MPSSQLWLHPEGQGIETGQGARRCDDEVHKLRPKPRRKAFDWISDPRDLTPFQDFIINGVDWNKSPLGPVEAWPLQLKQMVLLIVADPSPAIVYWGDDTILVYNEAYTSLIREKHPSLQGQNPSFAFPKVWEYFEQLLARQRETGETIVEDEAMFLIERRGVFEETYFSWKFIPIIGDGGFVVGSYVTVIEVLRIPYADSSQTTRETISKRRSSAIHQLSLEVSEARTIPEVWLFIMRGLRHVKNDVPLALLYSVTTFQVFGNTSNQLDPITCKLESTIGISEGHSLAPNEVDIPNGSDWLANLFRKVIKSKDLIFSTAPENLSVQGLDWTQAGPPPSSVVVCPVRLTNSARTMAFLVIALSPVRPYNEDYQRFIHLLTEQVATPHVSAVLLQEEVNRRLHVAEQEAVDRARLSRELSDIETKFSLFAARAPIGLAIMTQGGLALSANDLWRSLTMLEIGTDSVDWEKTLVDGELEHVTSLWTTMVNNKESVRLQTAVKKPWRAPEPDEDGNAQWTDTHLILALYPDLDDDGSVKSVMSCITDVSELKWNEAQLRKRMNQAIKIQQQQERFIDMTSHEMRNPLSALIGCADEIITSLKSYLRLKAVNDSPSQNGNDPRISHDCPVPPLPKNLLNDAVDAADTIIYCAMHQKRIIDDILTLSRLDGDLLATCPEPSQPVQLIRNALKMFEAELKSADTKLVFHERASLSSLHIDWTLLDPSRILQVFINLMTNAIKFTRTEPYRRITVSMAASLIPLFQNDDVAKVEYVPKSKTCKDHTTGADWGDGEVVYLSITVEDTGRGLSPKEREHLFNLFQQASPKTYVQYGGSGLGLFISRQLTEMQGGQIGVASEAGKGSTFQFYVKTRRTDPVAAAPPRPDFQLLVRPDAIREACGDEVPSFQNGAMVPDIPIEAATEHMISHGPEHHADLHILVVEDNVVNQKVVTKQLRNAGHIVSVANHGMEALEFLRRTTYWKDNEAGLKLSVVLMDLEMPVMDGITCVKKIRELQATGDIQGHVPVIAVTANARKDQILATLSAGMDARHVTTDRVVGSKVLEPETTLRDQLLLARQIHGNALAKDVSNKLCPCVCMEELPPTLSHQAFMLRERRQSAVGP